MYVRYVIKLNTGEILANAIIVNSEISAVEDILRATGKLVVGIQDMQRSANEAVAYSLVLNYILKYKYHEEKRVGPLTMVI